MKRGVLIAADPRVHDKTPMFLSVEFKKQHIDDVARDGWRTWFCAKRSKGEDTGEPVEALVGMRQNRVADLIDFERAAQGGGCRRWWARSRALVMLHCQLSAEARMVAKVRSLVPSERWMVRPAMVRRKHQTPQRLRYRWGTRGGRLRAWEDAFVTAKLWHLL